VKSLFAQRPEPSRVQLIMDANLAARARRELVGVSVPESGGTPGHLGKPSDFLAIQSTDASQGQGGGCDRAVS
jgi:hypothetical protein